MRGGGVMGDAMVHIGREEGRGKRGVVVRGVMGDAMPWPTLGGRLMAGGFRVGSRPHGRGLKRLGLGRAGQGVSSEGWVGGVGGVA